MPTLIEKLIYPNPPRYTTDTMNFVATPLQIPEMQLELQLNVIEPPPTLERHPYTILYAHANMESINGLQCYLSGLAKVFRVRVVSFDYLGYGINPGVATEASTYQIANAVMEYVLRTYEKDRIILWGKSVGSAAAVHLAALHASNQRLDSLILVSGLSSALATLCAKPPCTRDQFCNYQKLQNIRCKVLIVHGTDDTMVPFRNSVDNLLAYKQAHFPQERIQEYYDSLFQAKVQKVGAMTHVAFENAGHNDIDNVYEYQLVEMVKQFLGGKFLFCSLRDKDVRSQTNCAMSRDALFQ